MKNLKLAAFTLVSGILLIATGCKTTSSPTSTPPTPNAPPNITIIAPYGIGNNAYVAAGVSLYFTDGSSFNYIGDAPNSAVISQVRPFGSDNNVYIAAGSTLYSIAPLTNANGTSVTGGAFNKVDTIPNGVISEVEPYGLGGNAYVASGSTLYSTIGGSYLSPIVPPNPLTATISQILPYDLNGNAYFSAGNSLYTTDTMSITPVGPTPNSAVISEMLQIGTTNKIYIAAGPSLFSSIGGGAISSPIGITKDGSPILEMQAAGTAGKAFLAAGTSIYSTDGTSLTFIDTLTMGQNSPVITDVQILGENGSAYVAFRFIAIHH